MSEQTNNDWQRVRAIFDSTLAEPEHRRGVYLAEACGDDLGLLAEVESLLSSHESAELFLETPAVVQVAEDSLQNEQRLSPGDSLLHYEIRELIGSGGMGEVYLARDTRLNRNVAIKVLRKSFLPDAQASLRLLREARAAALLEHPNICQIYEISEAAGHSFIVMQYVAGKTLADVMTGRRIGIADALHLAAQIVEGLAEAHSHGLVHRDIKPANIIVNDKGQVKILDFGLAKFIEAETSGETPQPMHSSGAVMGTVPFMSPEQLRGKPVDARTDLFSIGALLYEMLTGNPAFNRDSNAETISSILNDEPDYSMVPAALRRILQKCLAKSVDDRYASTVDLLLDLRAAKSGGDDVGSVTTAGARAATGSGAREQRRPLYFWQSADEVRDDGNHYDETRRSKPALPRWISVAGAAVLLSAVVIGVFTVQRFIRITGHGTSLDDLKPVQLVSWKAGAVTKSTDYRVSHNGKMVAYSSSQDGGNDVIYIKQTSDSEEFQVTKDAWINVSPLWSPDDQQIAFVSNRQDKSGIYVTPVLGGVVTPLMIVERGNILLRHWSPDGRVIYYEQGGNLYGLDLETGSPSKITRFEDVPGLERYFKFSPDEQQIVFSDTRNGQTDLWTMPVSGGEPVRLTNDAEKEFRALWHPDGERILYNVIHNGFSRINLLTLDQPQSPVQVTRGEGEYVLVDLSPDGDRIYYAAAQKKSDVFKLDVETGQESEIAAQPELEFWPAVSPDGKSVVYHVNSLPNPTTKIYESGLVIRSADGQTRKLASRGYDALWLPDNRHISVFRLGNPDPPSYEVWLIDTVTGSERRITSEDVFTPPISVMPITRADIRTLDFSPDGERFVYVDMQKPRNAAIGTIDGAGSTKTTNNTNPNVRYSSPKFSRDGKLLAVVSLERFTDTQRQPVRRLHVVESDATSEIFSTTGDLRFIGWSHEGEMILALMKEISGGSPVEVGITSVALNGRVRSLLTIENAYPRTITLSTDGRTIAFTSRRNERDDIWIAPLTAGAEPKQISRNGTSRQFLTDLVFSPDGKTIFYDKQEEINTISMFENFY